MTTTSSVCASPEEAEAVRLAEVYSEKEVRAQLERESHGKGRAEPSIPVALTAAELTARLTEVYSEKEVRAQQERESRREGGAKPSIPEALTGEEQGMAEYAAGKVCGAQDVRERMQKEFGA